MHRCALDVIDLLNSVGLVAWLGLAWGIQKILNSVGLLAWLCLVCALAWLGLSGGLGWGLEAGGWSGGLGGIWQPVAPCGTGVGPLAQTCDINHIILDVSMFGGLDAWICIGYH